MATEVQKTTIRKYSENGNLVEKEQTSIKLKNTDKKDKFMLLYVEAYSHVSNLSKTTNIVLSELLKSVTTGENIVPLTTAFRSRLRNKLKISPSQLSISLNELCDKMILKKEQINQRVFEYKLNPYIFGSGTWADIRKQRLNFEYDFDFSEHTSSSNLTISTEYQDDTKEVNEIDLQEFNKNIT
ncbi:hypothetical protein CQA53_07370 [Helicobacter didelphidarum]|uniref:Plasmid replication protein RepL domain-containing protein n=1 Tax=Helicobacter didelphidarum TaxID=2040648 RepID=A0A3D8II59_9HELI|nr:hypothetical protein [Helicobacter didelphidarum]RDU64882.1 hypothetical protein CQA53_07370 [Helicobacter didelphidarum]